MLTICTQIVVDNENTEIVEILLHHTDIFIGNAVLYAIKVTYVIIIYHLKMLRITKQ